MKSVCQLVMIGKMDMICFPADGLTWQEIGGFNSYLLSQLRHTCKLLKIALNLVLLVLVVVKAVLSVFSFIYTI